MLFDFRIACACVVPIYLSILNYIEHQRWWTLRLWLAQKQSGPSGLIVFTIIAVKTLIDILAKFDVAAVETRVGLAAFTTFFLVLLFWVALPLASSGPYLHLRWAAWTGPSRTRIGGDMTRYLGDKQDWWSLAISCRNAELYPTEQFARFLQPFTKGIAYDATEILGARLQQDEEGDLIWVPRSQQKSGVYAPADAGQSVSLLWGESLGFLPRCSRGIIAVPPHLLTFQPKLKNGVDGRPICLAMGILARNKGLDPHQLVCELNHPRSVTLFEVNSALSPRPSKTLRSFYRTEMSKAFSGLGNAFVCAATELALLIADQKPRVVLDWLEARLEHQDLSLNNLIASLGATPEELSRLYKGHYVAMLISLSEHKMGCRLRPEITVYKAMCAKEGVREGGAWLQNIAIDERSAEEIRTLGTRGRQLVEAAIL